MKGVSLYMNSENNKFDRRLMIAAPQNETNLAQHITSKLIMCMEKGIIIKYRHRSLSADHFTVLHMIGSEQTTSTDESTASKLSVQFVRVFTYFCIVMCDNVCVLCTTLSYHKYIDVASPI